jgi:Uma2 family endonuclease
VRYTVVILTSEQTGFATPEDLLRMSDSVSYELISGRLVERHSGAEASAVAAAIGAALARFLKPARLGYLFFPDCGYQCFSDASTVRKMDVSFVERSRLHRVPEGHMTIYPDLAVEVLAPGDLAYEIDEKVEQYLSAGVKLVWVVNSNTRNVRIHRPKDSQAGPISTAAESDFVSGEEILPGFQCSVKEFFDV